MQQAEQLYVYRLFLLLVYVYTQVGDGRSVLAEWLSPNFIVDKDTFTYAKVSINQSSIFQDYYKRYIQVIVESQWLIVAVVIQGQT